METYPAVGTEEVIFKSGPMDGKTLTITAGMNYVDFPRYDGVISERAKLRTIKLYLSD